MFSYLAGKRICVTGGAGFLGRAVCARLREVGVTNVFVPRSSEFNLTEAVAAARMFEAARPQIVIHLAAEVGGIGANQLHPGRFLYANLVMGINVMEESRRRGVERLVLVGTVCAYPKDCRVPFREGDLWSGLPEGTNGPYGIAKRTLGAMLEAYGREYGLSGVYLVPANLYGPGDNFDPDTSHVIAAMIRRFCDAADRREDTVVCWGSGTVSREFLYVDDAAEAIVIATACHHDAEPINLGSGQEIVIAELARRIAAECGFQGRIAWDPSKPDGQPRRRLDTTCAWELLNWRAKTDFHEGLRRTIAWWRGQRGL